MDINFGSEIICPAPCAACVIEVDMRSQKMANLSGIEAEFPDPFDHGVKYRFRPAVDQQQFVWSALNERNTNNMLYSEVQAIDEVNHSER
jgi:hypothetical protein